jgi:hypothetical protein
MRPLTNEITGSQHQRLLPNGERGRFRMLAESAALAEHAAATAEAQRRISRRECQRLSVEACLARGRYFGLANDARRATAEAVDTQGALRRAAIEAYVTWTRQHRGSPESDHDSFVAELAEACDMSPRDLLRLIGRVPGRRTVAEREEDFERYRAGWSMRRIAKTRGINMSAVHRDIHARLARHLKDRPLSTDHSVRNQAVIEHQRVADHVVTASIRSEQAPTPRSLSPMEPVEGPVFDLS